IGPEHETGQSRPAGILVSLRIDTPEVVPDRGRRVEQAHPLIKDCKISHDPYGPGPRPQLPGDECQECRLAGAVGADHGNAFGSGHGKRDILYDRPLRLVTDAHGIHHQDHLARRKRRPRENYGEWLKDFDALASGGSNLQSLSATPLCETGILTARVLASV